MNYRFNVFPDLIDASKFMKLSDFIQGVIHYYDKYIFANSFTQVRIQNHYMNFGNGNENPSVEIVVNGQTLFEITEDFKKFNIHVDYNKKLLVIDEGDSDMSNNTVFQFTFDNYTAFRRQVG